LGISWRKANPEKWKAYCEANKEAIRRRAKDWGQANPDRRSLTERKRKYKLTETQLEKLLELGKCSCCGRLDNGDRDWCIDHDHVTGLVRGILCTHCNRGIGALGDNLEGALKAVQYLQVTSIEIQKLIYGLTAESPSVTSKV
jgi:hypothetical protein